MEAIVAAPTANEAASIHEQGETSVLPLSLASVLPFLVPFCSAGELDRLGLVDKESASLCDVEWRQRIVARFGALRFATPHWRKVFKLRTYLQRRVVENVSARVYLMNTRGETTCFSMGTGKSMMCSRERAIVYNRCERMFDLSLRINRSIQEISALIGMVSVDEARGLLNEHINLMASVASLRSSLMFESELFQVFPAPVLLDANTLLRGTYQFPNCEFLDSTTVMMQMWVSIDGLIYRPLAPPSVIQPQESRPSALPPVPLELEREQPQDLVSVPPGDRPPPPSQEGHANYNVMKLHELSGMTIHIDDNTLRYRLQEQEMCVNALVSNTYLLYLFNPMQFRPMDWTYEAVLYVGETRYPLPLQREGVFLNSNTLAMRVFLSYGKMPERAPDGGNALGGDDADTDDESAPSSVTRGPGTRGSEDSEPLAIAYDGEAEVFSFLLMATNRITKETREVANKAACFSLLTSPQTTAAVAPTDAPEAEAQGRGSEESTIVKASNRVAEDKSHERHVHLPYDAMICYCFSPNYALQYVEFAIGFEALLHRLGVSNFLPEDVSTPPTAT
jgi:hypothetical protein